MTTLPEINTSFTDNDKYWSDVGAKYTLHVWDILRNAQTETPTPGTDLFTNYDSAQFGLDDYPIYNETMRKDLNDNIIRAYLDYEIGYETEYLFRQHMRADMYKIMPGFNMQLKARAEAYAKTNALQNQDTAIEGLHKYLDTPQGQTDNIDDNYLTNVSKDIETHSGTAGNIADIAGAYTRYPWDIEKQIIESLAHNFLGLYL